MNYKKIFEEIYSKYNSDKYLFSDPIQIPGQFVSKEDIEVSSFITALFSYGNVNAIVNHLKKLFSYFQDSPDTFFSNPENIQNLENKWPYYRFQKSNDIHLFFSILSEHWKKHRTIENLFGKKTEFIQTRIGKFQNFFLEKAKEKNKNLSYGYKFLMGTANPNSANKRIYMFLRWMVRKDFPDFGLYNSFDPSDLHYPLDTHISQLAQILEINSRKSNDFESSKMITHFFRKIAPRDPVKFDFALSRLGILRKCRTKFDENLCPFCDLRKICKIYKKKT